MATRRSSSLSLSAEVSLSFRDELAATIHGAFEVAVEIAVLEISKLVSQALGDVREQMQETLRENKFLKSRLQSTELELDSARRGPAAVAAAAPPESLQGGQAEKACSLTPPLKTHQQLQLSDEASEENYKCNETSSEQMDESFREIREDGRVLSHDLSTVSDKYRDQGE